MSDPPDPEALLAHHDLLRAWLVSVLHNAARNRRRDDARRGHRERDAARPMRVPSTEEIVQREALRRQVVAAVLELDEPYRSTVLLRYFEGLEPVAIARGLGLTPVTVRTRLHRAHALLRGRLDRLHGMRDAWLPLLASLADGTSSSTSAAVATVTAGAFVMKKTVVAFGAVILLALALIVALAQDPAVPRLEQDASASAVARPEARSNSAGGDVAAAARPPAPAREQVAPEDDPRLYPGNRPRADLHAVLMLGWLEGTLLAQTNVRLRSTTGPMPEGFPLADDRGIELALATDARGEIAVPGLPVGEYEILVDLPDGRGHASLLLLDSDTERPRVVSVTAPHGKLWIQTVDAEQRGVEGVVVEALGRSGHAPASGMSALARATTDANGKTALAGPLLEQVVVRGLAPDGRAALAVLTHEHWREPCYAVLRLVPTGSIAGSIRGATPAQLSVGRVRAHAVLDPERGNGSGVGFTWDGRLQGTDFTINALPAGRYVLTFTDTPWRLELPARRDEDGKAVPNSIAPLAVDVAAGATTEQDLGVERGGTIAGSVQDTSGNPITGADVSAWLVEPASDTDRDFTLHGTPVWTLGGGGPAATRHPETERRARTDAAGRYLLQGLHRGTHRLQVQAPRLSHDLRVAVEVAEHLELRHVLDRAGVLQIAIDRELCTHSCGTSIGALYEAEPTPRMLAWAGPLLTFPGLPHGDYRIVAWRTGGTIELGRAHVAAGRTTWIDLRGQTRFALRGRVVDATGGVAGAWVNTLGGSSFTDRDGAFELRGYEPVTSFFMGNVLVHGVRYEHSLPRAEAGRQLAAVELLLGEHALDVQTLDRGGTPVSAALYLQGNSTRMRARLACLPVAAERRASLAEELAEEPVRLLSGEVRGVPRTDGRGALRLSRLPAGTYRIQATFADGSCVARDDIIVPGAARVVLRAPPSGTVAVTVVAADQRPIPNASVSALQHRGRTDCAGRVELRGVAAGDVELYVEEGREREHRRRVLVRVDETSEVRVLLR